MSECSIGARKRCLQVTQKHQLEKKMERSIFLVGKEKGHGFTLSKWSIGTRERCLTQKHQRERKMERSSFPEGKEKGHIFTLSKWSIGARDQCLAPRQAADALTSLAPRGRIFGRGLWSAVDSATSSSSPSSSTSSAQRNTNTILATFKCSAHISAKLRSLSSVQRLPQQSYPH